MIRTRAARALGLALLTLAAGPATAAIRAIDDQGRGVELPAPARRIVSLAPSVTEMLFAVGAGDRVVAVTQQDDYPPAARSRPRVGTFSTANMEAVVAQRPDLVVASYGNSLDTLAMLRRLGLRVFVTNPTTVAGVLRDMTALGTLAGRTVPARRVVASLQQRLDAVRRRVTSGPRVRTLLLVWDDPVTVGGGRSFLTDVIRAAGGVNAAGSLGEAYPKMSGEQVLALHPEVIVFPGGDRGNRIAALPTRPGFRDTPAARARRVYALDESLILRTGPRVVAGVERLARLLHPEAFRGKG